MMMLMITMMMVITMVLIMMKVVVMMMIVMMMTILVGERGKLSQFSDFGLWELKLQDLDNVVYLLFPRTLLISSF